MAAKKAPLEVRAHDFGAFWEWERATIEGHVPQRIYRPVESSVCSWEGPRASRPQVCASGAVEDGFCAWHHRMVRFGAALGMPMPSTVDSVGGTESAAGREVAKVSSRERSKLVKLAKSGRIPTAEDANIVLV